MHLDSKAGSQPLKTALWEGLERKKEGDLGLEGVHGRKSVEIYIVEGEGQRECFRSETSRPKEMEAEKKRPARPLAGWCRGGLA